jgi:hypothetical protein
MELLTEREKLWLVCIGIAIALVLLVHIALAAERFEFFAATGDSVRLVWSANTEPDLAGYRVYYYGPDDGAMAQALVMTADTTARTRVPLAHFWERVQFFIRAVDTSGNESASSDTVSTLLCKQCRSVGDVTGDGRVNLWDKMRYMIAAGSGRGDLRYNEQCDFNGDGRVDLADKMLMNINAGR